MASGADPDEGIVRLGLTAAPEGCPPSLGERLDAMAVDPALAPEMRALAIKAVGPLHRANTLPLLLEATRIPGGFLRRARLKEKGPELLAALGVLAQHWSANEEAAAVLTLAEQAEDTQVRNAARRKGGRG